MSESKPRLWAVIPAAGSGSRMGSAIPKQYLKLHNKTVLEHTIDCFLSHPKIAGVVIALSVDDQHWSSLQIQNAKLSTVDGGEERSHSVLNALTSLDTKAANNDWVLVHDAARPCLRREDIDHLIATLNEHEVGGVLGVRVSDTVKRTNANNEITETVDRTNLWRAMTPQMFKYGVLKQSIERALQNNQLVTDEASAIEIAGLNPVMVEGHDDNIKITHPQDLIMAERYFEERGA